MSSYLFDKYRKDKCESCLRAGRRLDKCSQTEHDIILCSSSSFYKGPDDENLLSEKEKQELEGEPA